MRRQQWAGTVDQAQRLLLRNKIHQGRWTQTHEIPSHLLFSFHREQRNQYRKYPNPKSQSLLWCYQCRLKAILFPLYAPMHARLVGWGHPKSRNPKETSRVWTLMLHILPEICAASQLTGSIPAVGAWSLGPLWESIISLSLLCLSDPPVCRAALTSTPERPRQTQAFTIAFWLRIFFRCKNISWFQAKDGLPHDLEHWELAKQGRQSSSWQLTVRNPAAFFPPPSHSFPTPDVNWDTPKCLPSSQLPACWLMAQRAVCKPVTSFPALPASHPVCAEKASALLPLRPPPLPSPVIHCRGVFLVGIADTQRVR